MARPSIIEFIRTESGAGVLLFFAAVIALIWDNSPLSPYYHAWLTMPLAVHLGDLSLNKPLLLWINDGLMALFFMLVGLEVKRELFEGELNSLRKATLPGITLNWWHAVTSTSLLWREYAPPELHKGWAIPAATDIAFSLGILALLGSRIPTSLKVFLTALAIFDDIGAIIVIAAFYTKHVSMPLLLVAFGLTLVLIILNRFKVLAKWPYLLIGVFMWICVLKSGVHATLVGIVVAFAIPLRNPISNEKEHKHMPLAKSSPARDLEHSIHPWIAYAILPIFALANAGVSFSGFTIHMFLSSLPLGICLGFMWVNKSGSLFSAG